MRTWIRLLAAFAAAFGLAAPAAHAGLLPVSVSVLPEAGNFRWTYAIVLPTDSQLRSGDYFTIYDFAGFVPGSNSTPDGWAFTAQNVGPTPDRINPNDDPKTVNLSWKYLGPDIPSGQLGLGNFWATSPYQASADSYLTARTHRTSDGKLDSNITETTVPVPVAVPEPTALVLTALGLPLVGLRRRLRRA